MVLYLALGPWVLLDSLGSWVQSSVKGLAVIKQLFHNHSWEPKNGNKVIASLLSSMGFCFSFALAEKLCSNNRGVIQIFRERLPVNTFRKKGFFFLM